MTDLIDLANTYTHVIGGGGFGVVKTGNIAPYDKYAVKFLYASECPTAKQEYITNKFVHTAYEIFQQCNPVKGVSVVNPYDYVMPNGIINHGTDHYDCAVTMERLVSPMSDGYAVHLAFNGVIIPSQLNQLRYAKNIPRGYFFGPEYIQTLFGNYLTLEDITYRIGILDGITIFGAHKIPIDAEYILTIGKDSYTVTMIDFGLFSDINLSVPGLAEEISLAQENNLYYHPSSEAIPYEHQESCKRAYISGFTDAYNCFNNVAYQRLYEELIAIYESF